jgi:hypothetical protein
MEPDSLKQLYFAKTDDELLTLEADQDSLTPEARSILANELGRRGLSVRRHPTRVESDTTLHLEENPAFNAPAKVGQVALALFVFGTLAFFFSMMVWRNSDWKRDLLTIALLILLIFGSIFAVIAGATRRNLRNARTDLRKRKD